MTHGAVRRGLVALSAVLAAASVGAADPADEPTAALGTAALAATCAQCHGSGGRPPAGSPFAALAGRPATEIVEAMRAYREGRRAGTVMPQLARGYDAEQVDRIAAWFAVQPGVTTAR